MRLCAIAFITLLAFSGAASAVELPAAAEGQVDFHTDVAPILVNSCGKCHAGGQAKGGFALDTRELLMAGGDSGAAVEVGNSADSLLVHLVVETDPDVMMPKQGRRLTDKQIGILRAWIDQGVSWEEGFTFKRTKLAELAPRKPEVPAATAELANPIDRLLAPYFAEHGVKPSQLVDDRTYIRRVSLDVVGLLPTPDEVEQFVADPSSDKRASLVRRLLADKQRYAEHWLTFWNDALRNDYRGTGYIDGGRKQITPWLYRALAENMPYDQFVRELVSPTPESDGFVKGIVWRGVVNASQVPEMQAAQNVSQVFFGINLKCASCHDSFIDDWKLSDAYGLAAVFAPGQLEMHHCDKPTGDMAQIKFLFPSLGQIDPQAPREQRLAQLAALLTKPENGRLSRTIVNRLWARLLGRGLVEPVDVMDNDPWNADLLDFLAVDLAEHKYDLKHTLELILTSRAYQLSAAGMPERDEEFVFRGPTVRRLSAEQFSDAVWTITGAWPVKADVELPALASEPSADRSQVTLVGKWIWSDAKAASGTDGGRIALRRTFTLDQVPTDARAVVTCDNQFRLWINGREVAASNQWEQPQVVDLTPYLVAGQNTVAAEAINWPDKSTGSGLEFTSPNPAGFIFSAAGRLDGKPWTLGSDANWTWSASLPEGWQRADFDNSQWQNAAEIAAAEGAPWSAGAKLLQELQTKRSTQSDRVGVRAALVAANPLMVALDRPNREQVTIQRPKEATTLQGLELTNGATLDAAIRAGAQRWMARHSGEPDQLIEQLYLEALGRKPTAEELALGQQLVGAPLSEAGVQDLLWIVTMLPEFQLVY